MTDFDFFEVAITDSTGGIVRLAPNRAITVTDPTTGAPAAGLKQSGQPVSTVTTDSKGAAAWTSTQGANKITAPNGLSRIVYSPTYLQQAVTGSGGGTPLATFARNPDLLIAGTVTRDANGAATSAPVTWPDGTPGTYTALVVSTSFPGAVDSYKITYGSPVTKTYTQPTVTRDSNGAAVSVPAITVT